MSEQSRLSKWIRRLVKISAITVAVVFVLLFVMSALSGNSDAMKTGLEQYLAQQIGGVAEIETLHEMTFYPAMSANMEGVKVYKTEKKEEVIFSAGKIHVALGFWDLTFSSGKVITLIVEKVKAAPGAITVAPLTLGSLGFVVNSDVKTGAVLKAVGSYNEVPYNMQAQVHVLNDNGVRKFRFDDLRPFDLQIGDINTSGQIVALSGKHVEVEALDMQIKDSKLSGKASYKTARDGQRALELDLALTKGTKIKADLMLADLPDAKPKLSGDVVLSPFVLRDLTETKLMDDLLAEIDRITSSVEKKSASGFDFSAMDVNVDLAVKSIKENDVDFFAFHTPVTIANNSLKIGPYRSDFNGSKLDGAITLDAAKKPAALDVKLDLKEWNYKDIQKAFLGNDAVKGKAHIIVRLNASGNTADELKSTMSGHIGFVGGKGEFPASALNIWGGGLLNALLPDFDPDSKTQLNCMIADFKAEEGVFETAALFMDTARVTLVGEGDYDLPQDKLDIQLTPKPKSISIGDISAAVNVKGPIGKPSISPSMFSLGKKLGGLLLGAINPAFLAFTLADLGLNENHPCNEFLKSGEEETE